MSVFTPEQVVALLAWQAAGDVHPFTCVNRGDGNHREILGDLGALVPTVRGWVCPFCDYVQTWAHDFMTEPRTPRPRHAPSLVDVIAESIAHTAVAAIVEDLRGRAGLDGCWDGIDADTRQEIVEAWRKHVVAALTRVVEAG